jgi:hypothetical protein
MQSLDLMKRQSELHVLDGFIQAYLPSSSANKADLSWTQSWKNLIVNMSTDSALVKGTIAALGMACIGQQLADEPMIRQGAKVYGIMLTQLNNALQRQHDGRTSTHIVAAIQLMGLYEQYNGFSTASSRNQGRNWQAHVLGMRRLVEILGPHAFTEDRAFFVYQAGQMSQFTSAFAARKASSLAARDWRTIPWDGRDKNSRDLFFDIVYPLPAVLEQAEQINAVSPEKDVLAVLNKIYQILARMEIWKCMVRLGSPADGWQLEGSPGSTGLRDPLDYDLPDRQTAILYASVVVNSSCIWKQVAAHLSFERATTLDIKPPDVIPYALWIVRAIPSITREGGIMGSQSVLFPMGSIRFFKNTFATESPEVMFMLEDLFTKSTHDLGYLDCMDGFLRNLTLIRTDPQRNGA